MKHFRDCQLLVQRLVFLLPSILVRFCHRRWINTLPFKRRKSVEKSFVFHTFPMHFLSSSASLLHPSRRQNPPRSSVGGKAVEQSRPRKSNRGFERERGKDFRENGRLRASGRTKAVSLSVDDVAWLSSSLYAIGCFCSCYLAKRGDERHRGFIERKDLTMLLPLGGF